MLHAAAAQHRHSQEEAQHPTIQGYAHIIYSPLNLHFSLEERMINQTCVALMHIKFAVLILNCARTSFSGGAVLAA